MAKEYKKYTKSEIEKLKKLAKNKDKPIVLGRKKQIAPQSKSSSNKNDKKREALPPGKRISKNGKIYYESRRDHSDKAFSKV